MRKFRSSFPSLLLALPLALALACSADSPSEPSPSPGPPPGSGTPNAVYNITVEVQPGQVPVGSTDPVQVIVRVRRADNGAAPAAGTTVVVAASAGSFGTVGGASSVVLALTGGAAQVPFFPPATQGTVVIQARLESSIGQGTLIISERETFFVSHLEPASGSPSGGDQVVIQGAGFEEPVRVTFNGVPAQVLSTTPTRIRVVTPPSPSDVPVGSTLPVPVSVTINLNEIDQAVDTLTSGFIYTRGGSTQQPQVYSVSPAAGPNEGGTRVSIVGEGFAAPVQVFFGEGASATSFTGIEATVESVTPNQIVVRTPPAIAFGQNNQNQTVDVMIKNLNTGFATIARSIFQYGSQVRITAMGPGQGIYTGGTVVTLFGQGFDEPVSVTLGGIAQPVVAVSGTEIVFRTAGVVVTSCPGDGVVRATGVSVTNIESGDTATADLAFEYLVPQPVITTLTPSSGPQSGGTLITLNGQGFEPPVRVTFTSTQSGESFTANVSSESGNLITARSPEVTNDAFKTEECDDNGDATIGTRYIATPFDVRVTNLGTSCTDVFQGGFTYRPTDSSCRNDDAPPPPDDGGGGDGGSGVGGDPGG